MEARYAGRIPRNRAIWRDRFVYQRPRADNRVVTNCDISKKDGSREDLDVVTNNRRALLCVADGNLLVDVAIFANRPRRNNRRKGVLEVQTWTDIRRTNKQRRLRWVENLECLQKDRLSTDSVIEKTPELGKVQELLKKEISVLLIEFHPCMPVAQILDEYVKTSSVPGKGDQNARQKRISQISYNIHRGGAA